MQASKSKRRRRGTDVVNDQATLLEAQERGGLTADGRVVISMQQIESIVNTVVRSKLSVAQPVIVAMNLIATTHGEEAARSEVAFLARHGVVSPQLEDALRQLVTSHPNGAMPVPPATH